MLSQTELVPSSHADLSGAQNQAHTKIYEGYIGLMYSQKRESNFFFFSAYIHVFTTIYNFATKVDFRIDEGRNEGSSEKGITMTQSRRRIAIIA
jgi:hypothetical protein